MAKPATQHRKVTYALPESLLAEVKARVREGAASSQSALVAEALREYLVRVRQEELRQEAKEAAADPAFLADLESVAADLDGPDGETARMIP